MAARLKSSVLRREERGIGSISMARLLVCGMGAMGTFMGLSFLQAPGLLMILMTLVGLVGGLVLTHPVRAIPLYLHLLMTVRTRFLLDSQAQPHGWQAQVVGMLEMKSDTLTLDASQLLAAPEVFEETGTLDGWEIVLDSEALSGFEVVTDTLFLEEG